MAYCPKDAAERIWRGAAALKERLAQDDAHYRQVAELQRGWKIRRAQPPQDRFYVDLSLRPSLAEPDPRALIDIVRVMAPVRCLRATHEDWRCVLTCVAVLRACVESAPPWSSSAAPVDRVGVVLSESLIFQQHVCCLLSWFLPFVRPAAEQQASCAGSKWQREHRDGRAAARRHSTGHAPRGWDS